MRKTLLPRSGYRDRFTHIQQWLIAHLVDQREFNIWDLIVSEIEDTIAEGFMGRCQLPYTHWLTYLIFRARADPLPPHIQRELTNIVRVFPHYDPRQMMRTHVDLRAPAPPPTPHGRSPPASPRATHSSGAVPETEEEQDVAIGSVADAEA